MCDVATEVTDCHTCRNEEMTADRGESVFELQTTNDKVTARGRNAGHQTEGSSCAVQSKVVSAASVLNCRVKLLCSSAVPRMCRITLSQPKNFAARCIRLDDSATGRNEQRLRDAFSELYKTTIVKWLWQERQCQYVSHE